MHKDHELHTRRQGRNFGVLAVLLAFVALMFGLTIVKIEGMGFSQGFDHVARPEMIPEGGSGDGVNDGGTNGGEISP